MNKAVKDVLVVVLIIVTMIISALSLFFVISSPKTSGSPLGET
jgi:hypothetical protein